MSQRDQQGREGLRRVGPQVWRSTAGGPAAAQPVDDAATQPIPPVPAAAGTITFPGQTWTPLPGTPWDAWVSSRRAATVTYRYLRGLATGALTVTHETGIQWSRAYMLEDDVLFRDVPGHVLLPRRWPRRPGQMLLRRARPQDEQR